MVTPPPSDSEQEPGEWERKTGEGKTREGRVGSAQGRDREAVEVVGPPLTDAEGKEAEGGGEEEGKGKEVEGAADDGEREDEGEEDEDEDLENGDISEVEYEEEEGEEEDDDDDDEDEEEYARPVVSPVPTPQVSRPQTCMERHLSLLDTATQMMEGDVNVPYSPPSKVIKVFINSNCTGALRRLYGQVAVMMR